MANVLDCDIVVSEFELQSRYNIHFHTNTFWKGMTPSYSPRYGLNSTTTVLLQGRAWRQITHEVWYNIKQRNQTNKDYHIIKPINTILMVLIEKKLKLNKHKMWSTVDLFGFFV